MNPSSPTLPAAPARLLTTSPGSVRGDGLASHAVLARLVDRGLL